MYTNYKRLTSDLKTQAQAESRRMEKKYSMQMEMKRKLGH